MTGCDTFELSGIIATSGDESITSFSQVSHGAIGERTCRKLQLTAIGNGTVVNDIAMRPPLQNMLESPP